jgi:hypothetical protein
MRVTKKQLQELEEEIKTLNYILRYEKGNFNGGYCIVKHTKVVVVNKFFSLEGKIAVLTDIIRQIKAELEVQKAVSEEINTDV